MVRFVKNISLSILLSFFLLSCGVAKEKFPPVDGNVLPISYSSLLEIVECDGYTVVDIADPWGSETLQRYILVPSASELPANLPQGVLLRTPLESVLLFSGVHAGLLCELGVENAIKGLEIDTRMSVKTFVLCSYCSMNDIRRQVLVVDERSVLYMKGGDHLSI